MKFGYSEFYFLLSPDRRKTPLTEFNIVEMFVYLYVESTTSEMLINMSSASLEEYYPAIAIAILMKIIKDSTLAQLHTMVVQVSFLRSKRVDENTSTTDDN